METLKRAKAGLELCGIKCVLAVSKKKCVLAAKFAQNLISFRNQE